MITYAKPAFLLFGLLIFQTGYADIINGRVIGVTDGDTIKVLDTDKVEYKIRLAGIDAPEKSQAFGKASKQSLSDLVYGRDVTVDWHKTDRYKRYIGKVILHGKDINLVQIKNGMAWYYIKYGPELLSSDQLQYLQAQVHAKADRIGLWADRNPIAPWDFRKSKKYKLPSKPSG